MGFDSRFGEFAPEAIGDAPAFETCLQTGQVSLAGMPSLSRPLAPQKK